MLLSSPDLLTLTELLSGLRDRHSRIAGAIKDKIKALGDALSKCKEAHEKADQSLALITRIQAEMKELQKPIGSKVEDVQGLLDSYQVRYNKTCTYYHTNTTNIKWQCNFYLL